MFSTSQRKKKEVEFLEILASEKKPKDRMYKRMCF